MYIEEKNQPTQQILTFCLPNLIKREDTQRVLERTDQYKQPKQKELMHSLTLQRSVYIFSVLQIG